MNAFVLRLLGRADPAGSIRPALPALFEPPPTGSPGLDGIETVEHQRGDPAPTEPGYGPASTGSAASLDAVAAPSAEFAAGPSPAALPSSPGGSVSPAPGRAIDAIPSVSWVVPPAPWVVPPADRRSAPEIAGSNGVPAVRRFEEPIPRSGRQLLEPPPADPPRFTDQPRRQPASPSPRAFLIQPVPPVDLTAALPGALPVPRTRSAPPEQSPTPPDVHITIGRIEVRAVPDPPRGVRRERREPSAPTLEDYLRRRDGRA